MSWIYLTVLFLTIVPSVLRGWDLFSPVRMYLAIYSLLMSIYSLELSRLQSPWSSTSLMLFWGANFIFIAGGVMVFLVDSIHYGKPKSRLLELKSALKIDAARVDWEWYLKIWFLMVVAFGVSFGISYAAMGELPIFSRHPDDARMAFFSVSILTNYGIFCGPLSMMMAIEWLVFSNGSKKMRTYVISLSILVFLLYLALITRYDIFRFFLFAIVIYHYGRKQLGMSQIFFVLLILTSIFLIGFAIRVQSDTIEAFNEVIKVKMPAKLSWASNFYAYVGNDFWNFDYAIRRFADGDFHYPIQWGFGLVRGFLSPMMLEGSLIDMYHFDNIFNHSIQKVKGLNTVIYIWGFFQDFGTIGVYGLTLAFSLTVGFFYSNYRRNPTVIKTSLWALFVPTILLSFHIPLWQMWFFYFNIFVILIAHKKLRFV